MKRNTPTFTILVATVLLLFGSGTQAADNADMLKQAKESLQAVEALNSAVSAGVTRPDYIRRKADAKIAVDKFINQYGSKNQFAFFLRSAMYNHGIASDIWGEYYNCEGASNNFIPISDPIIAEYIKSYPELKKYVHSFPSGDELYYPTAVSYFWSRAGNDAAAARKVLESAK